MTTSEQNNSTPPLYGLVLAGGKSVRMGQDKGSMPWHGKEQKYYMADLLQPLCSKVFISCREGQQSELDQNYNALPDSYDGGGPIIGILSAFKAYPHAAWLVTACDLPLLDKATLQYLIQHREATKIATTFSSPFDSLPEPLITIWEPASYVTLQAYYADNFKCPRKLLIRNEADVKVLIPPFPDALINTNTPEDAERVQSILGR